jgi:hypothetical protein
MFSLFFYNTDYFILLQHKLLSRYVRPVLHLYVLTPQKMKIHVTI